MDGYCTGLSANRRNRRIKRNKHFTLCTHVACSRPLARPAGTVQTARCPIAITPPQPRHIHSQSTTHYPSCPDCLGSNMPASV